MKKHFLLIGLLFIAYGTSLGADRFQLESELRTSYTGGASSFSHYSYDAAGNRISKRAFDGLDSLASLLSKLEYVYDAQNRAVLELLLGAAGDTLSKVSYAWSADGMTSASTLRKDGTLRFKDSLVYAGGLCVEQRRYNGSLAMTFFRRHSYNGGLLAADSLYESDGVGGFTASAALLFTRNADSTVSAETQWRKTSGQWYCISTTVMAYTNKNLVSATTYEGDATAKRLMDSLAYTVDSYGNRTLEAHFDDERTKTYDIAYTWRDTQPVGVAAVAKNHRLGARLNFGNGRLDFGAPVSGSLVLCRIDGRRVCEQRLAGETSAYLPTGLSAGSYVAMVRGTVNQSLSITITN